MAKKACLVTRMRLYSMDYEIALVTKMEDMDKDITVKEMKDITQTIDKSLEGRGYFIVNLVYLEELGLPKGNIRIPFGTFRAWVRGQ